MESSVRPDWLVVAGLLLTFAAAFCFSRGWLWPALGLLVLSTPLDLIGARLASLRLQPLSPKHLGRRMFGRRQDLRRWRSGGGAANHGGGWGAFFAAWATCLRGGRAALKRWVEPAAASLAVFAPQRHFPGLALCGRRLVGALPCRHGWLRCNILLRSAAFPPQAGSRLTTR